MTFQDIELPTPTLLEIDGSFQSITDGGSETRGLLGGRASGLAVNDSDIHDEECSSFPIAADHQPGKINFLDTFTPQRGDRPTSPRPFGNCEGLLERELEPMSIHGLQIKKWAAVMNTVASTM